MSIEKKEWLFIVNPVAGLGFAGKYADTVKEMATKYNVSFEMVFTERKGHATELAGTYIKKGFRYIIAVGGDGTVNETARALVDKKDAVLGCISAGTGNDFNQIPGFPERFGDKEWEIFFEKHIIPMDVGTCNGNIFLNGMGVGFDAQVASENFDKDNEIKTGGNRNYWWHVIKNLLFYKEKTMTVITDEGKQESVVFMKTIGNGRRLAGDFLVTPKAFANDGLLDVCMIEKLSLFRRLRILLKVPKGTHIEEKKIHYFQTDSIRLEFDHEVPHHLDGELFFASIYEIGILPGKINLIYNPQGNHFFNV
jgi:YegS/Rv2252/BmrU family lipid kinase